MRERNDHLQMLYESLHDKMIKVAYRMIGNIETAEDLVQSAFLLALFHQKELQHHPSPEGWMMRVLQNLALNERRRLQRHQDISFDTLINVAGVPPATSVKEILPQKLPEHEQEILIWRFEENLDYDEIASRLGISPSGCRSRVCRAISHCRKLIEEMQ